MSETVTLNQGYDWRKTVWAAVRRAGIVLGAVAAEAVLTAGSDENTVSIILGQSKASAGVVGTVFVVSAAANWWKNRNK